MPRNKTNAAWFREQLEAVEADLLVVVRKHYAAVGPQVVAHALVEFSGSVLAAIATEAPASRAEIETKLAELRLFVAAAGQRAQ
jgi:hypothetical protein